MGQSQCQSCGTKRGCGRRAARTQQTRPCRCDSRQSARSPTSRQKKHTHMSMPAMASVECSWAISSIHRTYSRLRGGMEVSERRARLVWESLTGQGSGSGAGERRLSWKVEGAHCRTETVCGQADLKVKVALEQRGGKGPVCARVSARTGSRLRGEPERRVILEVDRRCSLAGRAYAGITAVSSAGGPAEIGRAHV